MQSVKVDKGKILQMINDINQLRIQLDHVTHEMIVMLLSQKLNEEEGKNGKK